MANFFNNKGDDNNIFCDINVTPMVDIMLVLLIIFMVTAPFMMNTIGVNLPKGIGEGQQKPQEPLTISINKESQIYLAKRNIDLYNLSQFLKDSPRIKDGEEVFIEADEEVKHGFLMKVMSMAYEAGAHKINLLMEKN